jgi:hypothetical protein
MNELTTNELNIKNLENCFNEAIKQDYDYVAIKVKMLDMPKDEIIINPRENFEIKLNYYKHAYNDDLTLRHNANVQIVGFTYGDRFEDIECDFSY